MLTSAEGYRVLPNCRYGANPFGGHGPGDAAGSISPEEAANETRLNFDGTRIGCLEGEAAYQLRITDENGAAILDEVAELAGRHGIDRSLERLYLCVPVVAALGGVVGDKIQAMIDDESALDATDAAIQLLALIADCVPTATAADPGDGEALPVASSAIITMTSGGSETRTLGDPLAAGTELKLILSGSNSVAVTAAHPIDGDGDTVATFDADQDTLLLVSARVGGALRWRVVQSINVDLT